MDIGQGAGLAGASGVRPFLPPLLAGALARQDAGIDFDGTDWRFLESPWFLLAVLALAVLSYGAERSGTNRSERGRGEGGQVEEGDAELAAEELAGAAGDPGSGRDTRPVTRALGVLGAVLGALLFAGVLADGGHEEWPGLIAGAACAALAWAAVSPLLERARARLDRGAAGLLSLYAEGVALALTALAIVVPPVSFAALAAFAFLLVQGRARRDRKYAGLRVLR